MSEKYNEKNIKTIVLSELPKNEKVKYFQFLIENDVNFTKDEKGNYIAMIKVLNPSFYKDVEFEQERIKATEKAKNNCNSAAIHKKTNLKNMSCNFNMDENSNKTASFKKLNDNINNKEHTINNNKDFNQDDYVSNNKKHSLNYKSSSVPKNNTSQIVKSINNKNENNTNNLNNLNYKNNNINYNLSNKLNSNKHLKKEDSVLGTTEMLKHLKVNYPEFMNILQPLVGVRPKKINLYQLKYLIEELYSVKFMIDTATIKSKSYVNESNNINKNDNHDNGDTANTQPFKEFLIEFKTEKYVKKPLVDKNLLDILITADFYKDKDNDVKTFISFLTGEYDSDDLIFYLFVRTCIEKEMKMMFMEKAKEEIKLQYNDDKEYIDTNLYLTNKVCLKIAKTVFGENEEELLNSFMTNVEENSIVNSSGRKCIPSNIVLKVMLEDYHNSRKINSVENNTSKCNTINNDKKSTKGSKTKEIDKTTDKNEVYNKDSNNIKLINTTSNNSNSSKSHNNNFNNVNNNNNNLMNTIKKITYKYIKEQELDIFFAHLMQSYTFEESDNDKVELVINNIKEKLSTKLILLIAFIFSNQKDEYYQCLRITEETEEDFNHYKELVEIKDEICNFTDNNIPHDLLELFGQTLLTTEQLVTQINNFILSQFGNIKQ